MPLTADDQKKYKSLYLQTARPYLADLEMIASLQDNDAEKVTVIHRAAHSLGSQSLMMDYNSIGGLSRLIEKIFKAKKEDGYTLNQETKEVLVRVVSKMKDSLDAIENSDKELVLTPEIDELRTVSKITV